MVNDLTIYKQCRPLIAPGDVVAFGGDGIISGLIKFLTRSSVSHVGVVLEALGPDDDRVVNIIESTTLSGKKGVQINRMSDRVASYDGRVWWLPLSKLSKRTLNGTKMYQYAMSELGEGYDYKGLAAFLLRQVPGVGLAFHGDPPNKDFCSELVAEIFTAADLLHGIDDYELTPQRLCEMNLYAGCVQLAGKPQSIRNFNTR